MSIQTVGIIGAGTMGNGIAQACAVSGSPTAHREAETAKAHRG